MPDKDKNQPMPEAEPESRPTASGFGYLADKNSEDICRFLQAVIDRAPFGICITDSERHVILANRTIENMTGFELPCSAMMFLIASVIASTSTVAVSQ